MGVKTAQRVKKHALIVANELGLHARSAALIVKTLGRFDATVRLCKDGQEVNARSILEMLLLAAVQGDHLEVRAEGREADAALSAVVALFEAGFHEKSEKA